MGNLGSTLAHSIGFLRTGQIVDLQQHQSVVGSHHALFVPVLHLRRKTHLGYVLRIEMEQTVHRVILLTHFHQRIDVTQLSAQLFISLFLDYLYELRQIYLSECHGVAVVLDNSNFGHVIAIIDKRPQRYDYFL